MRRRGFIAVLAGVSTLALGAFFSRREARWISTDGDPAGAAPGLVDDHQGAVLRIVTACGPWNNAREADANAHRFASEARLAQLGTMAEPLVSAANRLPPGAVALAELDLEAFPKAEQEALLAVVDTLYGVPAVLFDVAGEPPPGICAGGASWVTEA